MSVLATDAFTRADAANLGANWSIPTGDNGVAINSNQIINNSAFPGVEYYSAAAWPNDHYSQIVLKSICTVSDQGHGPAVRVTSGGDLYLAQASTSETRLYKRVGGSYTQLGSDAAACAVNDVLYLEVQGTSLVVKKNGSTIITATDSAIASGNAGIWDGADVHAAASDDWAGGNFVSSVSTTAPYRRPVPMRPGPRGFTKGRPFQFSTTNPLNPQTVAPDVGSLIVTGFAPSIDITTNAQPSPSRYQMNIPMRPTGGGLSIGKPFRFATQAAAGAAAPITVAPDVGALIVTGFAPTIVQTNNQFILPDVGTLTVTGFAPTVTASDLKTVAPDVGTAIITGFAPTIAISDHQTVAPGLGQAIVTGFEPTVLSGDQKVVQPGTGQVTATGFAPTVSATANITLTPSTGQVTFDGFAPTVTATANITIQPGCGQLVFTGYAPDVPAQATYTVAGPLVRLAIPFTMANRQPSFSMKNRQPRFPMVRVEVEE